jgi:hypothetical protein
MTTPAPALSSLFTINTSIKAPQQIWTGGSGVQPFIFNNDEVNTLYVGTQADVLRQDPTSTIPIPPLGGQSWPDVDIWAFAPIAVQMLIIPGASSWAPSPVQVQVALIAAGLATASNQVTQNNSINNPGYGPSTLARQITQETNIPANMKVSGQGVTSEIAALLATGSAAGAPGGVPLLNLYNSLADASGTVITTGNQVVLGPFTVSQIAYEFVLSLATLQNTAVAPVTVDFTWTDSTSGLKTADQNYGIYAAYTGGGGPAHLIEGHGPSNADTVTVTIFNAGAQSVTVSYALLQSSRNYLRHEWRTQTPAGNIAFPTMTYISCVPAANILAGQTSGSLNNSSTTYLLPFYVGSAQLWGSIAVAANAGSFLLLDTIRSLSNTVLARWKTSSGDVSPVQIMLPRDQCQLEMSNGTATASTMSVGIVAQELQTS